MKPRVRSQTRKHRDSPLSRLAMLITLISTVNSAACPDLWPYGYYEDAGTGDCTACPAGK